MKSESSSVIVVKNKNGRVIVVDSEKDSKIGRICANILYYDVRCSVSHRGGGEYDGTWW
jgi:hypothetical protein